MARRNFYVSITDERGTDLYSTSCSAVRMKLAAARAFNKFIIKYPTTDNVIWKYADVYPSKRAIPYRYILTRTKLDVPEIIAGKIYQHNITTELIGQVNYTTDSATDSESDDENNRRSSDEDNGTNTSDEEIEHRSDEDNAESPY